ncbi:hypothetical protein GOV14_00055 [Candidatus Pacearchaeota archaeon]|nr:hypothetical protein [Candidatus Pacearchaeota archaeon]
MEEELSRRDFIRGCQVGLASLLLFDSDLASKSFKSIAKESGFLSASFLYYSPKDKKYINHCILTDQIGVGKTKEKAMTDLLSGIDFLRDLKAKHQSIQLYRVANTPLINKLSEEYMRNPNDYENYTRKLGSTEIITIDMTKKKVT